MNAFESSIRNGRLKPFECTEDSILHAIATAREELVNAKSSFGSGYFSDTVTHAYFAMCKSARSLLMAEGYKDSNLYSLVAGLNHFYVAPGILEPELVELLKISKDQKDLILQGARSSPADAGVLLAAAEKLTAKASEIVGMPGPEAPRHSPDSEQ